MVGQRVVGQLAVGQLLVGKLVVGQLVVGQCVVGQYVVVQYVGGKGSPRADLGVGPGGDIMHNNQASFLKDFLL